MYLFEVVGKTAHPSVTSPTKVVFVNKIGAVKLVPIIAGLVVAAFQMRQQRAVMNEAQIAHLALVVLLSGVGAVMDAKVACGRKGLITNVARMRLDT